MTGADSMVEPKVAETKVANPQRTDPLIIVSILPANGPLGLFLVILAAPVLRTLVIVVMLDKISAGSVRAVC